VFAMRVDNVEHNGGFQQPEQCEILDPSACCDWLHLHSNLIRGDLCVNLYGLDTGGKKQWKVADGC